jgi:hypothetical protein
MGDRRRRISGMLAGRPRGNVPASGSQDLHKMHESAHWRVVTRIRIWTAVT